MNTGNADLIRIIRAQVQKRGPISFAWFMQQALYHPEHGYYSSGRCVIGLNGDNFAFVERRVDKIRFNQAALDWIDQIAANLQRSYVIAIDYGFLGEEFERNVQVRAQHRHLDSPFEQIGDADITVFVHWKSIVERAQANGLRVAGFTDQHHFLTGIICQFDRGGSPERPAGDWGQSPLPDSAKVKRELQTLLHPEMLGRAFQVLALAKNVNVEVPPLAGFEFARQLDQSR